MRAKEIINELGNAGYQYQQEQPGLYIAQLPSGEELIVQFVRDVKMAPIGGNRRAAFITIEFFVGDEYRLTGTGDQFRILATVMKILQDELPRVIAPDIEFVDFTAESDEPSRIALYTKAAPRITQILQSTGDQWKFDKTDYGSLIRFLWYRSINKDNS